MNKKFFHLIIGVFIISITAALYTQKTGLAVLEDLSHQPQINNNPLDYLISNHIGGMPDAIAIAGDKLYAGFGTEFAVIDVTDIDSPTKLSSLLLPSPINNIVVEGQYAYIGSESDGLIITDICNPFYPIVVTHYDNIGELKAFAVLGDFMYLGDVSYYGGLVTIDKTEINFLLSTDYIQLDAGEVPAAMAVENNYLYIVTAANAPKLRVFSLSNPDTPIQTGYANLQSSGTGIAVNANYVYVATDSTQAGFQIFNVANPTQPNSIATLDINPDDISSNTEISLKGQYVYAANEALGLQIIDITNPNSPSLVNQYKFGLPSKTHHLAISNEKAFLTDTAFGIRFFDITNPTSLVSKSGFMQPGYINALKLDNNVGYFISDKSFWITQITDSKTFESMGVFTTTTTINDFTNYGNYAYLATDNQGVRIVDISSPAAPKEIGFFATNGSVKHITKKDHYLYLHIYQDYYSQKLIALDITIPDIPIQRGETSNYYYSPYTIFEIYGNHLFTDNNIYDVSDPAKITQLSYYINWCCSIEIQDQYAFIAGYQDFKVIELESQNYWEVTTLSLPYNATDLTVSGNLAYVLLANGTLEIIDIADPQNAKAKTSIAPGGNLPPSNGIYSKDQYLYLSHANHGLSILKVNQNIYGSVLDSQGYPLKDIPVRIDKGKEAVSDLNGEFYFSVIPPASSIITPTHKEYRFNPPSQIVKLAEAVEVKFTAYHIPVSVALSNTDSKTITLDQDEQLEAVFYFPGGAVTTNTQVTVAQEFQHGNFGSNIYANHAFSGTVAIDDAKIPDFIFEKPISITINYSESDIELITNENSLALYLEDNGRWEEVSNTCSPVVPSQHDLQANTLTVFSCKLGKMALFGSTNLIYLPTITNTSFPRVQIMPHVSDIGWLGWINENDTAGVLDEGKHIEAIFIRPENFPSGMNIKYQVHVHNMGWLPWAENNQIAGTIGRAFWIEAIRVQLDNPIPGYYVYYQVYARDLGWMNWVADGDIAGTVGQSRPIEGIRIRLVKADM